MRLFFRLLTECSKCHYTTRENMEKMAGREIDFVGSMGREEMQSGATAPNRLPPGAFLYQPETNRYLCPEGKLLRPQGRFNTKSKRGFVAYCYEAKISDCAPSNLKPECCPENTAMLAFREKMTSPAARNTVGVARWQSSVTRGSKASWVCGSFA